MNRLADQSSPYLRQHAANPVEWYPWGDEAFAAARRLDRPILLSIGYSACHWCHVMAHESFEDPAMAGVMNELFVNIKVDREERPDVDAVYMDAVQSLTGHGGWPMTVWLTPDGEPFFGGTYYPSEARGGMPSFLQVCRAVDDAWRTRRDELAEHAAMLTEAVTASARIPPGTDVPGPEIVRAGRDQLVANFDTTRGGFGRAPKFPHAMAIDLLLGLAERDGDEGALDAAVGSLDAMAAGGIRDHLAGGFARYSVDDDWLVPHFEKMLYDNALLVRSYLHAWSVTGDVRHLDIVDETIAYLARDLRSPDGAFYSAEDADSEGIEGRFYIWTAAELRETLGPDAAPIMAWYGATDEGNAEELPVAGANVLHRPRGGTGAEPDRLGGARARLLAARADRPRPGLDDKILAEWNGLVISALAEAGARARRPDWIELARAAAVLCCQSLRRADGRWLRTRPAPDGTEILAYAADHAALVDAFTRVAEATGEARWITEAIATADALLDLFWDHESGGVFTTGSDGEVLIARQKDVGDNAVPSANSAAAVALRRLGTIIGEHRYLDASDAILRLLAGPATRHGASFAHLLVAFDLRHRGSTEVVVAGDRPDLVAAATARWRPDLVLAWGERYDSPLWADRRDGFAYVCRDYACRLPAASPDELSEQLSRP